MKVFIDIETIPGQKPELREEIAKQTPEVVPYENPKCPRNFKKQAIIQEWYDNTFPALQQAAQKKYQDDLAKCEVTTEMIIKHYGKWIPDASSKVGYRLVNDWSNVLNKQQVSEMSAC